MPKDLRGGAFKIRLYQWFIKRTKAKREKYKRKELLMAHQQYLDFCNVTICSTFFKLAYFRDDFRTFILFAFRITWLFLKNLGVISFEKTCQKTGSNYNFLKLQPQKLLSENDQSHIVKKSSPVVIMSLAPWLDELREMSKANTQKRYLHKLNLSKKVE